MSSLYIQKVCDKHYGDLPDYKILEDKTSEDKKCCSLCYELWYRQHDTKNQPKETTL